MVTWSLDFLEIFQQFCQTAKSSSPCQPCSAWSWRGPRCRGKDLLLVWRDQPTSLSLSPFAAALQNSCLFLCKKFFFLFQLSHELQHVSRCNTVIKSYYAISAPSLLRLCSTRVFKVPDEPCAIQSHQGRLEWLPTRSFLSFSPSFFSHPLDNFLASLHSCNALVTWNPCHPSSAVWHFPKMYEHCMNEIFWKRK